MWGPVEWENQFNGGDQFNGRTCHVPCARGMSYSISLNPTLLKKGGRIRQQLDQYGDLITIVVGKFNELSEWGHKLLEAIAESRVALTARRQLTGLSGQG